MREIIFYKTESGNCPVEKFLDSLNSRQAQKMVWVLSLIEELDRAPSQYFKKLVNTDGLWEVRLMIDSNIFRILGFWDGDGLVVLTCAFQKKSQKTPLKLIRLAEKRKQNYFQRKYNE